VTGNEPGADGSEQRVIRRVLITGVAGSAGSYLAEHVLDNHPEVAVHGVCRWHSSPSSLGNLDAVADRVRVHNCDLGEFGATARILEAARPDVIFHLAAHANVGDSFVNATTVLHNNVNLTATLLEAVRWTGLDPIIQLCSTSEVYGQVRPEDIPITETTQMRPASPYAVSKCAQDLLGHAYFAAYGIRIVRTRMFSYINPRRTDLFATAFARQIALIEMGLAEDLVHGNLDSVRTIIDHRDAMRAYWAAIRDGQPGEVYNIGGSTTATVGAILDMLCGMTSHRIRCRLDPGLLRPVDVTLQVPSVEKFREATGWAPLYRLEESLAHLLEYWRRRARSTEPGLPAGGRGEPG
jgi:GDP-4-dehydro-6-deoxy-D-mannose reductase